VSTRAKKVLSLCPDCGVKPKELHQPGCDVERCPDCGRQIIGCACDKPPKAPRLPWTGEWPGLADCRELGLWCLPAQVGFTPVPTGTPGAIEDMNRLCLPWAEWDAAKGKWARPGRSLAGGGNP
jgi:hypothetical protein